MNLSFYQPEELFVEPARVHRMTDWSSALPGLLASVSEFIREFRLHGSFDSKLCAHHSERPISGFEESVIALFFRQVVDLEHSEMVSYKGPKCCHYPPFLALLLVLFETREKFRNLSKWGRMSASDIIIVICQSIR